ncbi:hypothetical protein G3545_07600 [Starkeya sp. ORNL1]|nr:hypothetical protein G3545_07600 [Starkeya sp. ORNL1]
MTSNTHPAARKASSVVLEGKKKVPALRVAFARAAKGAGILAPVRSVPASSSLRHCPLGHARAKRRRRKL